jgi:FkbM family methyltransferase
MELYGQEPEAELLASLVPHLSTSCVIDVGAERGAFAEVMLDAGSERVDLIEPAPDNLAYLRERFADDARAVVHAVAAGEVDGTATLHLAARPDGLALSFGHTVLERPGTQEIEWPGDVDVEVRSLASLASSRDIPQRIGLLKVDTEGNDLAVIRGLGKLDCDVIMVEHWLDVPRSLGPCPWSAEELVTTLAARGFSHFAFLLHRDGLVTFRWDDAAAGVGEMGNVVFVQDRVLDRLAPLILEAASRLALASAARVRELRVVVEERSALIEAAERERQLQAAAATERLAAFDVLRAERDRTVEQLSRERDLQARAARERLETIDGLAHERDLSLAYSTEQLARFEALRDDHEAVVAQLRQEVEIHAAAAKERLATLERVNKDHDLSITALQRERDDQTRAAAERLAMLESLAADRDLLATAAEARLIELRESELRMRALEQECELQAATAAERLATIEELNKDRDGHAAAAAERLVEIERLTAELKVQSFAAEQRLAAMELLDREQPDDQSPSGWS